MEKLTGRELHSVSPLEAVSEAMMVAYAQNFKVISSIPSWPQISIPGGDRFQHLLANQTKENCERNSTFVIYYLIQRHPELFDLLLLLRSERQDTDLQFQNPGWFCHFCFLVKDRFGTYYAGSPANFNVRKPNRSNNLNRIIYSPDINKVIRRISTFEGGPWPTSEQVKQALASIPHSSDIKPTPYKSGLTVLKVPVIRRETNGIINCLPENHFVLPNSIGEFINPG